MRVLILGCGPAGLLAAHAANRGGVARDDIVIMSRKVKSDLHGAQYMGRAFPGLNMGDAEKLEYILRGTSQGYRTKVYGPGYAGPVSPDEFEGFHHAWDIRRMYNVLWGEYSDLIREATLGPTLLSTELVNFDRIYSSIPKPALCFRKDEHRFATQHIWAIGDSDDKSRVPYDVPKNTIICYGNPEVRFYRLANVFGYRTIEWPLNEQPFHKTAVRVGKPLLNDCDCWDPYGVIQVGRFGAWRKGVLVHHTYDTVMRTL